jgi:hypothetical protein
MCFKEPDMPKVTSGGFSDQTLPVQDELPFPDEAVPVVEDNSEHDPDRGNGPDPVADEAVPDEQEADAGYSSYSVRDLVELCKARGVAYSGPAGTLPKDALAARLSALPKE